MTRLELVAELRQHPNEAVVLATATHVLETIQDPGRVAVCASAWALDAARRWACGEADLTEVRAAAWAAARAAATADDAVPYVSAWAAAWAARAPYAGAPNAIEACVDAAWAADDNADGRAELSRRLPAAGRWGAWRQGRVIARAGDYLWREAEGRFVVRWELTPEEAVDLDGLEQTYGPGEVAA